MSSGGLDDQKLAKKFTSSLHEQRLSGEELEKYGIMTQATDIMVDEVFLVGNKLIFAGMFQRTDQKEIKGTMEILVNGKPLQKIRIEGEVFDNTGKTSLWATIPIGLDLSVLKENKISLKWENNRNC